jgi:hypothetical protein
VARGAVGLLGCLSLTAGALLAIVHLDDRYAVGHVSGAWMGLAAATADGTLYPPLYEDGVYGGTRFMPLFFAVHGALAGLSGELLVSGKLLTLVSAAALVALVAVLSRRLGAPLSLSLGLAGAILASWAATSTVFGIRGDALSVLLQIAAVALVAERTTSPRAAAAGALCGLALLTKLSALWAPAALGVWLAWRARRLLLPFAGALVATAAVLALAAQALSAGRFSDSLTAFAFAGGGDGALEGVRRLFLLGVRDQRSLWPVLLLGVVAALAGRRPGPYELALAASALVLAVVLRDLGAYENHLLDLTVLGCLVTARGWTGVSGRARTAFRAAALAGVVLATLLAGRHTLLPDVRDAIAGSPEPALATRPLDGVVDFGGCVLSEDASLPLLAGYRPVVLDAFMVLRLREHDPDAVEALRLRVERSEFAHVVLIAPADDPVQYTSFDFGPEIAAAVRSAYVLERAVAKPPLWVYRPRVAGTEPCRAERLELLGERPTATVDSPG